MAPFNCCSILIWYFGVRVKNQDHLCNHYRPCNINVSGTFSKKAKFRVKIDIFMQKWYKIALFASKFNFQWLLRSFGNVSPFPLVTAGHLVNEAASNFSRALSKHSAPGGGSKVSSGGILSQSRMAIFKPLAPRAQEKSLILRPKTLKRCHCGASVGTATEGVRSRASNAAPPRVHQKTVCLPKKCAHRGPHPPLQRWRLEVIVAERQG